MQADADAAPPAVILCGTGELARRVIMRCASEGVRTLAVGRDLESLDAVRALGTPTVYGQAWRPDVLRAAHIEVAHALVVTDGTLADKMAICIAARAQNPRLAIVATAMTAAERAWLTEFGVAFVCDALDGVTDAVVRSVRRTL